MSPRERSAVDDMKRRAGLASDANLLRTALYRFAVHLDINTDPTLFQIRGQQGHAFDCDLLEDCICRSKQNSKQNPARARASS